MNQAIKLAIEKGGYKENLERNRFGEITDCYREQLLILDPLFWQALGKALGMSETQWFYTATQYFTCLMKSGDTEKFWKELISYD